jgi:exonuclease III
MSAASTEPWWPKAGWISLLVHNYGGIRKLHASNDAIRELLLKFPAHIVVLQEHDPHRLFRAEENDVFHVCLGGGSSPKKLAILGRKAHSTRHTPCIESVTLLEFDEVVAKEKKKCYTAIMVAEIRGASGYAVRIVNVHFHPDTARKESGHKLKFEEVLDRIAALITKHHAHLLIGDFNRASTDMVHHLQSRKVVIREDSRHPLLDDCIRIFSIGPAAPGRDSKVAHWRHINGAHWPIARHFGSEPARTEAGAASRKRKGFERLEASKAKKKRKEPPKTSFPPQRQSVWPIGINENTIVNDFHSVEYLLEQLDYWNGWLEDRVIEVLNCPGEERAKLHRHEWVKKHFKHKSIDDDRSLDNRVLTFQQRTPR